MVINKSHSCLILLTNAVSLYKTIRQAVLYILQWRILGSAKCAAAQGPPDFYFHALLGANRGDGGPIEKLLHRAPKENERLSYASDILYYPILKGTGRKSRLTYN